MNIRHVEVFRAVMINGTASRAAEVLRISQPAVSKAVQELERSIGFLLFQRIKGRLRPTAECQMFFREVEQAFSGLSQLRGAAARIRDFGSGNLRMVCLSALSTNLVPQSLRRFMNRHPDVAVTLQTRTSSVARDLVASGQFDLGIVADEIDTTELDVSPFRDFPVAVAVPEGHELEKLDIVRPHDLAGHRFIALSPEDTTRRQAEDILAQQNVTLHTVLETPFSTTICAMIAQGLGIGLVNPLTAKPYVGRGLTLRPYESDLKFRTLLILPPNRPPSRIISDLIDDLRHPSDE